jgi:hypothetical protein
MSNKKLLVQKHHPAEAARPGVAVVPRRSRRSTDRAHFENQYRLIDALFRRGQLNAKPFGQRQRLEVDGRAKEGHSRS